MTNIVAISDTPLFDALGLEVTRDWFAEIRPSLSMAGFVAGRLGAKNVVVPDDLFEAMKDLYGERLVAIESAEEVPQSVKQEKTGTSTPPATKGKLAEILAPGGGLPRAKKKARRAPGTPSKAVAKAIDPPTQPIPVLEGTIYEDPDLPF